MMTRLWKILSLCLFAFVLLSGYEVRAAAADTTTDDTYTINVTGTYGQTEARSMLTLINEFRTSTTDAWYWDEDDETKITCSDLSELTYDYELEEIAMQRAMELAISYSHTRPDGTKGTDLIPWVYYNDHAYKGENIAAGYTSAEAVFAAWQETDENYEGQGHRRNMLSSNFRAIGIGHVYYQGKHFWVQCFASGTIDTTETTTNDSLTTKSIDILKSSITSYTVTPSPSSYDLTLGETAALPTASVTLKTSDTWISGEVPVSVSCDWSVTDGSIAEISNDLIQTKAVGTTTLTTGLQLFLAIPFPSILR